MISSYILLPKKQGQLARQFSGQKNGQFLCLWKAGCQKAVWISLALLGGTYTVNAGVHINLSSLFLRNLLSALSIKHKYLIASDDVLYQEIARLRTFLGCYLQQPKPCSGGRLSSPVSELYQAYQIRTKSKCTGFTLYNKLSKACQYIEKRKVLNSDEHACLSEIFHSDFLDLDECRTGLESKTLQRILNPREASAKREGYFPQIEFIVTNVLPRMELAPSFAKRLEQLSSAKAELAGKLFTYKGRLVQFEKMDEVIEELACWDESWDCAARLGQILKKLRCIVTAGVEEDAADGGEGEDLLLDEAGFHQSSHDLITSHLAMFNVEIPAASLSEFNRNIYQIISGTVYQAYIDRCRNENYTPSTDSWKEGFKNDKIAAGLVLHGLHMDRQMHQSFCKRLEEIASAGRWGK